MRQTFRQKDAQPILISAWSRADGVSGKADAGYAISVQTEAKSTAKAGVAIKAESPGCQTWVTESKAGKIAWRYFDLGLSEGMRCLTDSPCDPDVILSDLDMGTAFITRDGGKKLTSNNCFC